MTNGPWRSVAAFSLTAGVRVFERGLLDAPLTLRLLLVAATLFALASIWLPTGRPARRKAILSAGAVLGCALATAATLALPHASRDVTEDRRNSFDPADERALRAMPHTLTLTIRLAPEDSRLQEFEANVLGKLRRMVPHLVTRYADTGKAGLYDPARDDRYGIIVYEYGGARDESRSTSPREILPLLHRLAGQDVIADPAPAYPGYPLVVSASGGARAIFYGGIPALIAAGWWFERARPARLRRRSSR